MRCHVSVVLNRWYSQRQINKKICTLNTKKKKNGMLFVEGLIFEVGPGGKQRGCSRLIHSRRTQTSAISMETKERLRVFQGKEMVGWEGGGVWVGMINDTTPCCHLYFGIQSKAQFSVKYYIGLSRRQSLMLMYE